MKKYFSSILNNFESGGNLHVLGAAQSGGSLPPLYPT